MHPMTRVNLRVALEAEAMTALRCDFYAEQASAENLPQVADLFARLAAEVRRDHAFVLAEYVDHPRTSRENLAAVAEGELTDHRCAYPIYAEQARRIGDVEAAALLVRLARRPFALAEELIEARRALAREPVELATPEAPEPETSAPIPA